MDVETRPTIMQRLLAARLICKPLRDILPRVALLGLASVDACSQQCPHVVMGHVGALTHCDTL